MIKLGLENLFAVNTFSNISLHDALKQNAGKRKCQQSNSGYPCKVHGCGHLIVKVSNLCVTLELDLASCSLITMWLL